MSFKIQSKGNVIKIVCFLQLFCSHYFLSNYRFIQKTSTLSIEEEKASYELLPVSTDTTFSIFWSQNEKKLPSPLPLPPLLAQIVRSVCCAPPTTVSSEQDFSMGSDIVTQKRNKLSDKRVECLSFLKRNLSREFSNES